MVEAVKTLAVVFVLPLLLTSCRTFDWKVTLTLKQHAQGKHSPRPRV